MEIEELRDLWQKNAEEAEKEMDTKNITVSLEELAGVPDDIIDELLSDEKDDKKKIITFYDTLDILVFTKNNDLIAKMETLRDIG